MMQNWMAALLSGLATFNRFLVVAEVISAASLLLYSLTFNLRDRVARSWNVLLAAVAIVSLCDVASGVVQSEAAAEVWVRLQWLGIALIPGATLHLSDALLATTGQPSRGRRRWAVRGTYAAGLLAAAVAWTSDFLVGRVVRSVSIVRMTAGPLFPWFTAAFAVLAVWSLVNAGRAYLRCLTPTTRRRMGYLLLALPVILLGVFPYLLLTSSDELRVNPLLFWVVATGSNFLLTAALVLGAYCVGFFGAPQPDRVVKSRMLQWILRGPVVAWAVVAAYVFVNWLERRFGIDGMLWLPVAMVGVLLLAQFSITVVRLPLERWLFYGGSADRYDVQRVQHLSERLLTAADLRQFLESVLAASCDTLRITSGFVMQLGERGAELQVQVGSQQLPAAAAADARAALDNGSAAGYQPANLQGIFHWGEYWLLPLRELAVEEELDGAQPELLGMLGLHVGLAPQVPEEAVLATLLVLASRAAEALQDRRRQQQLFQSLDVLVPQVESIQRLRAAAAYNGAAALASGRLIDNPDVFQWVKDALVHYWGGPKLTSNPLLALRVVKQALQGDENPAEALRGVLRDAIEYVRPAGQRKYTGDWLLYNILELRFVQRRKSSEVARQLSVSEADLFRKQRVAVEQVARKIAEMEAHAPDQPVVAVEH
ncbi:MAG: hypothetical protein DWI68_00715 [Chloroflexi bacterium]|nr:MAG: hypothetical protein DWI68_00715 [Chloroflexota bacterium]